MRNRKKIALGLGVAIIVGGYLLFPTGGRIRQWARTLPSAAEKVLQELPKPVIAPAPLASSLRFSPRPESEHSLLCGNFYKTICKKLGVTRDPSGVVQPDLQGEIEALRMYEEIIRSHPSWTSAQVDAELVKKIYTPVRRERMISAFKWVRSAIEKLIEQQSVEVLNRREKQQLKSRIRKVVLELPPPAALYQDEPDLFTKNDVYYERTEDGKMRLRVGGAFLFSVKSWFNLVFTMAHEFGHSIDPCEISTAGLSFPAYDRLKTCFIQNGWVKLRNDRQECQQYDQAAEAFADWLAVQVSAESLKTFATEFHGSQMTGAVINSVRDLCEQDDPTLMVDSSEHPEPVIRIEEIFGRHSTVREILGCAPEEGGVYAKPYCQFDTKHQVKK